MPRLAVPQRHFVVRTVSLGVAVLCCGCTNFKNSLRFEQSLLVKVPATASAPEKAAMQGVEIRSGEWHFRHMLEAPSVPRERNGDSAPKGQWYLAWRDADANSKPRLMLPVFQWRRILDRVPSLATAVQEKFQVLPLLIEPNKQFRRSAVKDAGFFPDQPPATPVSATDKHILYVNKMPGAAWPVGRGSDGKLDPVWHLRNEGPAATQLLAAREYAHRHGSAEPVVIGHLDNGMSGGQAGMPRHLVRGDLRGNAIAMLAHLPDDQLESSPPDRVGGSHGTGTVGILAGGYVSIRDRKGRVAPFDGDLGGAPDAVVVPVRVAPWVFSLSTANLAYGIDYASRVKGADVITMSHGGAPSQAWVDAVNAAYERGTAMFAAEADFFSLTPKPFKPYGLLLPSGPVYPAAFRRVMGVTGSAADGGNYAQGRLGLLLSHPWKLLNWMGRGNYGPDGSWRAKFRGSEDPDMSVERRVGLLRAHPIAAPAPNIPWLVAPTKKNPVTNLVDLDSGGTSSSTPLAAAAAALWLQTHRDELRGDWHTWKKAEAVYQALLAKAKRPTPEPDLYLGAGHVKAMDSLALSYADVKRNGNVPYGSGALLRWAKAPRDYFDGDRTIYGIFGRRSPVKWIDRAEIDQHRLPANHSTAAMQRLYYNMLLLREWNAGQVPDKTTGEKILRARAEKLAAGARNPGSRPPAPAPANPRP